MSALKGQNKQSLLPAFFAAVAAHLVNPIAFVDRTGEWLRGFL